MSKKIKTLQKKYDAFLIAHGLPDESADDLIYRLTWDKPSDMSHITRTALCDWLVRFKCDWNDALEQD